MTVIRTLRAQEAAPWPVYQQPPMRCPDNKKGNNELDEPIVLRCNELLLIVVLRSLFRDCLRPVERRLLPCGRVDGAHNADEFSINCQSVVR